MNFEAGHCTRCGKTLRDFDPFDHHAPVSMGKNQEVCPSCYRDLIELLSLDN